jgi:hypothetical protein
MPQLTLDTAVLEMLLKRAMSASHRIRCIEDGVHGPLDVELLADDIDAIIHELTESLGNPHLIAASVPDACSTFGTDDVTRADLVTKRWNEPTPPKLVAAFTATGSTRPGVRRLRPMHRLQCQHVGKGSTWQAHPPQAPAVEPSRLATGWVRGATITALIALLSVISILLTLGACIATGGAR